MRSKKILVNQPQSNAYGRSSEFLRSPSTLHIVHRVPSQFEKTVLVDLFRLDQGVELGGEHRL